MYLKNLPEINENYAINLRDVDIIDGIVDIDIIRPVISPDYHLVIGHSLSSVCKNMAVL